LAKSIMDAAWAILRFQLRYQAESAGAYGDSSEPTRHDPEVLRLRGNRSQENLAEDA
jgi:hypothetical protein